MKEVMKSSREMIFDEILKNPYITNKEIEKLTGFNETLVKLSEKSKLYRACDIREFLNNL